MPQERILNIAKFISTERGGHSSDQHGSKLYYTFTSCYKDCCCCGVFSAAFFTSYKTLHAHTAVSCQPQSSPVLKYPALLLILI